MSSQESIFSSNSIHMFEMNDDNVDVIWKTLFDSLSTVSTAEDCEHVLETVKSSFSSYLKYTSMDEVQTKLLQYVCPIITHLFQKNLEQISEMTKELNTDNSQEIKKHLNICLIILNIIGDAISQFISWDKVDIMQIESLPKTVANILLQCYTHCKESETIYGKIFPNLVTDLTTLFRKTSELNIQFFLLLNNILIYDEVEGIALLNEVLDTLVLIGEIVVSLDLKTMAEHWKGFIKLLQQNVDNLQTVFSIEKPLSFLAANIENILKEITNPQIKDSKMITRQLKEGSFELKLILKLCESFPQNINLCISKLIDLQIILYEYSAPYLNSKNIPLDVIDSIESHLIIGTEPLFMISVKNSTFIESYFRKYELVTQTDQNKIGFLFLTSSILKYFPKMENNDEWISEKRNIFKIIFEIISKCHPELCTDLKIPIRSDTGDAPIIVDLYELLLTHLTVAALTLNNVSFQKLEGILLESILQPNIWKALLAIDLWCILGRYGTSELCYNQLIFLTNLYRKFMTSTNMMKDNCPEQLFLSLLIYRLYSLLSIPHQLQYYEQYPFFDNIDVWHVLGLNQIPQAIVHNDRGQNIFEQVIDHTSNAIESFLNDRVSNTKFEDFVLMCNMLQIISTIPENTYKLLNNNNLFTLNIIALWDTLNIHTLITNYNNGESYHKNNMDIIIIYEYYFKSLCQITSHLITIQCLNNSNHIYVILKCLIDIFDTSSSSDIDTKLSSNIKLSTLIILNSLATLKTLDDVTLQTNLLNNISKLFKYLLLDCNKFIKQLSLEIFNYFAYTTSYENIVKNTVAMSTTIRTEFMNYVQKIAPNADMNFIEYLKLQQEVFHQKISMKIQDKELTKENPRQEIIVKSPSIKKMKIDFGCVLNRILNDVDILVTSNSNGENQLMENQMKIHKIIDNLSTLLL